MEQKPFNLQKALAGNPVVTRDGYPVLRITHFEEAKYSRFPVIGVVNGAITEFTKAGYNRDGDVEKSLYMAPITKKVSVAVYRDMGGNLFTGQKIYSEGESTEHDPTVPKASNFVGLYSFEIEYWP